MNDGDACLDCRFKLWPEDRLRSFFFNTSPDVYVGVNWRPTLPGEPFTGLGENRCGVDYPVVNDGANIAARGRVVNDPQEKPRIAEEAYQGT